MVLRHLCAEVIIVDKREDEMNARDNKATTMISDNA
jgi:hypothetical protein